MKRLDLIKAAQSENKNETTVKNKVEKEKRGLQKEITDLEYKITDKEAELSEDLSDEKYSVDKSVVISRFAEIETLKNQKALLQKFVEEYYA